MPNLSISAPLGIEKILDDEAPTNIRINDARVVDGWVALANNEGDDFVIGTLSATDPDTDQA
jgi:hypothetical protein